MAEPSEVPRRLSLRVGLDNLSEARGRVAALIGVLIADESLRYHFLLAIEEAVQNVVRHGYPPEQLPGRLDLSAWREGGDLIVELRDYAPPADPATIRPRGWDPARPGGLGLRLIQAAMDEVCYSHAPAGDGNLLRLRKRLE